MCSSFDFLILTKYIFLSCTQEPNKNNGGIISIISLQREPVSYTRHKPIQLYINMQADVILNTTTSFPNLNGAIPDALIRQGGKTIRDECNQCVGSATDGDIIETGGGNLSCNSVLHYVLPTWDSRGGVQVGRFFFLNVIQC